MSLSPERRPMGFHALNVVTAYRKNESVENSNTSEQMARGEIPSLHLGLLQKGFFHIGNVKDYEFMDADADKVNIIEILPGMTFEGEYISVNNENTPIKHIVRTDEGEMYIHPFALLLYAKYGFVEGISSKLKIKKKLDDTFQDCSLEDVLKLSIPGLDTNNRIYRPGNDSDMTDMRVECTRLRLALMVELILEDIVLSNTIDISQIRTASIVIPLRFGDNKYQTMLDPIVTENALLDPISAITISVDFGFRLLGFSDRLYLCEQHPTFQRADGYEPPSIIDFIRQAIRNNSQAAKRELKMLSQAAESFQKN